MLKISLALPCASRGVVSLPPFFKTLSREISFSESLSQIFPLLSEIDSFPLSLSLSPRHSNEFSAYQRDERERGLTNEIVGERFSCFSRSSSRHRNIFEISSYRVPTSIGFSQHRDDDTSCDRSASKLPTYSRYAFVRETGIGRRVLDERGRGGGGGRKKGKKGKKRFPNAV